RITDWILTNCYNTPFHDPRARGLLFDPRSHEERPMYCHAFAMTYLALIFAQETDPTRRERIRQALHDAIEVTERSQTSDGGWGYRPNYREDEGTLVVTQLQGLRACRDAGIHVPKRIIDRAINYIRNSTNPDGSVRYRVSAHRTNVRSGVSCAAIVALWQAGRYDDPLLRLIRGYVESTVLPSSAHQWRRGHHAEYVQYYLAQSQLMLGGESWTRYYRVVADLLLGEQSRDGSWEGRDRGDVFGTTIALLILQMPYHRLSVYQR
ncbi:MAG TPA: prenyltransferase/squalene oxidase repeat-containing protein, partial [Planctomycetota bacterium]|nr:prenyltransferase/squalene oxidase repeat-containing protein [Planctomycetota bacterium]